jgi:hypothetical protein
MRPRLIVSGLLLCSLTASADFWNGRKLLGYLEMDETITARGNRATPEEGFNSGLGVGYVVGIYDVINNSAACAPPSTTVAQLVTVVYAHLRTLTARQLDESADILVADGLRRAFPCGARRPA